MKMNEQPNNVYQKLSELRIKIQDNKKIKKTGQNKYAKFSYWELDDFLPTVKKYMAELGVLSSFIIDKETAYLTFTNCDKTDEKIVFESLTAEDASQQIKNPIQLLGCKITYLRRYLWIIALELTEKDSVEALAGEDDRDMPPQAQQIVDNKNTPPVEVVIEKPITETQLIMFEEYRKKGKDIKAMLKYLKLSKVEDMIEKQALKILNKWEDESRG